MSEKKNLEFKEYIRCAADKSSVWTHFLRTTDGLQAQCKMCKKVFKTSGTTSSLHNHLRLVHSIQLNKKTCTQPLQLSSSLQAASTSAPTTSTSDVTMMPVTKKAKTIHDFFYLKDQDDLDTMLAKMTAVDGVPFKIFCSSDTMKKLFHKAGYKELPKSPNTIKKRVMNKSEVLKEEVKKELNDIKADGKKFAVSLDEWTSARNRRYVNINIHSPELSEGFRNLGLTKISGRGTSENCYNILKEKLAYYDLSIENDISCMVSDGASVMCALGRMIPSYHQLCLAHGIQCAVLDVLYKADNTTEGNTNITAVSSASSDEDSDSDVENENENGFVIETDHCGRIPKLVYKDLITKVRKTVKFLKCSPTRMDIFNLYLESKYKDSALILDCKTRWSSLADMIARFLQSKYAIQKTLIDLKVKTTFSDAEILILKDLSSSLNIIKATVEEICGRKSNLLSAEIALQFMMEKLALSPDIISRQLTEALSRRISQRRNITLTNTLKYLHNPTKYFEETEINAFPKPSNTEIIATIVKINEMYFCQDKPTTINEFEVEDDLPLGEIQRQRFEDEMEQAAKTFKEQLKTKVYQSLQGAAEVSTKNLSESNDLETSVRVEMALLDRGGPKSIHLQRVYDFLLTIPPTSVEAERVFSANRFFCNHLRSSMNDDTLDALSFLRSYFLNKK